MNITKHTINVSAAQNYQKVDIGLEVEGATRDEVRRLTIELIKDAKKAVGYMAGEVKQHDVKVETKVEEVKPVQQIERSKYQPKQKYKQSNYNKQNTDEKIWWDGVSDPKPFMFFISTEGIEYKILRNKEDGGLFGLATDETVPEDLRYFRLG